MGTAFNTHRKRDRLKQEITTLQESYTVEIDHDANGIILTDFRYPANWTPRTAPFMLRVTPYYPYEQPAAYLSADLRCTDSVVWHRWSSTVDGYYRWCLHPIKWRRQDHDLETFLDLIHDSLKHPDETHPYTWSDDL
jgi:hypothetical protein